MMADGKLKAGHGDAVTEAVLTRIEDVLRRLRLQERWPLLTGAIHVRMAALHGGARAAMETGRFMAKTALHLILIGIGAVLLSLLSGGVMLGAGVLLMLLYAGFSYKSLDARVKERQRLIIMELPELLNKLTLLINAGETVHQAIHRCAASRAGMENHPLVKEWLKLSRALKDNTPFVLAMEEFSRSCSVLEVSMFTTAVMMNFRRGGSDFVIALEELSHTLWERRKAMARMIGEEASSKLVFPMVMLFCTVMAIVAAPAILMMG